MATNNNPRQKTDEGAFWFKVCFVSGAAIALAISSHEAGKNAPDTRAVATATGHKKAASAPSHTKPKTHNPTAIDSPPKLTDDEFINGRPLSFDRKGFISAQLVEEFKVKDSYHISHGAIGEHGCLVMQGQTVNIAQVVRMNEDQTFTARAYFTDLCPNLIISDRDQRANKTVEIKVQGAGLYDYIKDSQPKAPEGTDKTSSTEPPRPTAYAARAFAYGRPRYKIV